MENGFVFFYVFCVVDVSAVTSGTVGVCICIVYLFILHVRKLTTEGRVCFRKEVAVPVRCTSPHDGKGCHLHLTACQIYA